MHTGLFIGRFQPLHRGHLMMIKGCATKVERLIIGLGSADATPSCKNPFTAVERAEMIRRGLKEMGVKHYEIVELPDYESDEEWVKVVIRAVAPTTPNPSSGRRGNRFVSPPLGGGVRGGLPSPFDIAWSGSEWVLRVFKEHGLPIESIKEFPGLSGTKIRKKMAQGLPWLKFVPLSVRKYLREIRAVRRARALCFGSVSTTDKKV